MRARVVWLQILSQHIPQLMRTIQPQGREPPPAAAPEDLNPFAEQPEDEWAISGPERIEYEQRFATVQAGGKVAQRTWGREGEGREGWGEVDLQCTTMCSAIRIAQNIPLSPV